MAYETYRSITGIIQSITDHSGDCCSQRITLLTSDGVVHFILSGQTVVIDHTRLRPGMRIAAFYDSNLPVPLIFPPQYQAQLITTLGRNENIMLAYFDANLTAADGSLSLNIDRTVRQTTINGQSFTCNPADHELLVYYTVTSRSIPPQTTPRRIVVLC